MFGKRLSISTQFVLLLVCVLVLNAGAFFLLLKNVYLQELRAQAQTVVANVDAFGSWVARNGRVWVREDQDSFLGQMDVHPVNDPEQTVTFYSKNPALAQREFSETVAASASPAKFRMTSQNVMNPANTPDAFESRALNNIQSFDLPEFFETVDGEYRYAKPVFHTAACISCHGSAANAPQDVLTRYGSENGFGFEEGDLAGIISVTIPQRNILAGSVSLFGIVEISAIALSILLILWFVRRTIIRPVHELTEMANSISRGQETDLDVSSIPLSSRNEIDQLKLATSRMKTSFNLSIRKVKEARSAAQKAIRVAKALKAQQSEKQKND
jgi:methyl-accepting chemotaxis protein